MPRRPERHPARRDGVQSLHRALDLVEVVAARGGHLTIGEIAAATDVPLPTVHRLLRTLVDRGYMRQMPNRRYALGFRLVPLGATASSMVGADTEAVLGRLVDALGETANLAILSGSHAEYVAQVPSRHTMRMFTEVGRQVDLHCTGVGKALLGQLDDDGCARSSAGSGCTRQTEHTLVTEAALLADLAAGPPRGYALDEQEQEAGVRCVAVAGRARAAVVDGGVRLRPGDPDDRRAGRARRPAAARGRAAADQPDAELGLRRGSLLSVLAVVVGVLIGMVGVGGVLLPPGLVALGGLTANEATATSTWAFVFTGVVGTVAYAWRGVVPWGMFARLAVGVVPAAFLGALVNATLPASVVLLGLGALTLFVGVQQLRPGPAERRRTNWARWRWLRPAPLSGSGPHSPGPEGRYCSCQSC